MKSSGVAAVGLGSDAESATQLCLVEGKRRARMGEHARRDSGWMDTRRQKTFCEMRHATEEDLSSVHASLFSRGHSLKLVAASSSPSSSVVSSEQLGGVASRTHAAHLCIRKGS